MLADSAPASAKSSIVDFDSSENPNQGGCEIRFAGGGLRSQRVVL